MDNTLNQVVKVAVEKIIKISVGWNLKGLIPIEKSANSIGIVSSGVSVVINFGGTISGKFVLKCPYSMAKDLAVSILGIESGLTDEDIMDALGELLNMITGRVKKDYLNSNGHIGITTAPTAVSGKDYRLYIKHNSNDRLSVLEFPYKRSMLSVLIYLIDV